MEYDVCLLEDLEVATAKRFDIEGLRLAVVRLQDDQVHIVDDRCSHADYSLSEGELDTKELTLECWKHGSAFSLLTGEPQCFPATKAVKTYETKVQDGVVKVFVDE